MGAKITFCGGVGTVTGANFLFDTGVHQLLIDCGALQQEHTCDTANAQPFPYDVREIRELLVTHAHQDHIGRIPKLVRDGFRGEIHSTLATRDLAALMFDDALGIMRDHAKKFNCAMLYEDEDVRRALTLWKGHEYRELFQLDDVSVELLDAGHILGSAMIRLTRGQSSILFTGDLGNSPEPLLHDTESPVGSRYLVMESVYGDRVHEDRDERKERLREAIESVRERNGTLLIPSFSLERTQVLLYELNNMVEDGSMRSIPIFLDAPLATKVTGVFRAYSKLLNDAAREHFARGDDPFSFPGLSVTQDFGESHSIHDVPNPKVIIAGAGMSAGGRIRSHEKEYLGDAHNALLFVGYQAPGTLGRRVQDGETHISIEGTPIRVRAHISSLTGYSGHADRDQLVAFIESTGDSLKRAFITMGEPKASAYLAQRAHDFLGVDAVVPQRNESYEIDF
jgi:metallo-beta-lactamase family protein